MEQFAQYAQIIGSHMFVAYKQQVIQNGEYTTTLFHLFADGTLKKMVYTGTIWQGGSEQLVEDKTLTAEDFVGKEDVLATLIAELEAEKVEYMATVAEVTQTPQEEFPI